MRRELIEGITPFVTDSEDKISREMSVFYNPVMKLNRDTTLAMLLVIGAPSDARAGGLRIGLPLEASGLRAARILRELVLPKMISFKRMRVNDRSPEAIQYAKENIALNKEGIDDAEMQNVTLSMIDANIMLREEHFDYIDIDPFGTPNPFLDAACQSIERGGMLAVTATDTSALAGTYPAATARKYWAAPIRNWLMHEAGLRILIRKVQLIGAQYEKGLVPVLSMSTDHYYRIFFRCERSHTAAKDVIRNHGFLHVCGGCMQTVASDRNSGVCPACARPLTVAGPLWTGPLHDRGTVSRMHDRAKAIDEKRYCSLISMLSVIIDECKLDEKGVIGFYDVHEIASRHKLPAPRRDALLSALGETRACRTHISGHGIKTDLPIARVVEAMRGLHATDKE
ncbi:TPA: hypothetical protein HA251_06700 [Candidatus Woesearchaeota archaeon]|nr:hypothetical protein [Candidatus Woesearchaeota archaeon]